MKAPQHRLRTANILAGALALAVLASLSVLPAATPATAAGSCVSTPFVSNAKKRTWYRIPAVVKTDSAVVAFAERRDNDSTRDRGNYDIVARTSTDNGCHWGALVVVANDGRNHVSSPVPIWDAAHRSLLLFSSIRDTHDTYVGLFLQRSDGTGRRWSPLRAGKVARPQGWKGGLQGPGHGIVLQHGTHAGRIIFAMGYKLPSGRYGTYGLYSDDAGRTWQIGYDRAAPGSSNLIEGTLAELSDGRLLVSYRDKRKTKPGTNRFAAVSVDGGRSISAYRAMPGIRTMAVEGALLQLTGPSAALLFSGPSFIKTGDLTIRRDMTIFISTDAGAHWHKGPLIGHKRGLPAAYSDLVQLDPSTVGIAYETGKKKWRERIDFVQVPLSSLR